MFTPEQEAALQKLIDNSNTNTIEKLSSVFSDSLEKVRRDLTKSTNESTKNILEKELPAILDKRFETIAPSIKFIEEVKAELETEKGKAATTQPAVPPQQQSMTPAVQQPVVSNAPDPALIELQNQIKASQETFAKEREAMKQRLEAFEKQAQEAEQRRVAAENDAKKAQQREEVLGTIRANGSVRPGVEKQLLLLLESEGLLEESEGKLKVKAKDKFGEDTYKEFGEVLPTLLESQFSHFVSSRPGTGTGIAPQTQAKPVNVNLEGLTPQDMYERAKSGGDQWKDTLAQLSELYK